MDSLSFSEKEHKHSKHVVSVYENNWNGINERLNEYRLVHVDEWL